MIFKPLSLAGSFEVLLEPRGDERGFFSRFYCDEEFSHHGLNSDWAQMNISLTRGAGSLRGLHFQRGAAAEVKLVRCLRGRVYDVIVDLREGSSSFGRHVGLELDADRRNSVYIPEGFAHGFQTLEDEAELQYLHSQPYSAEQEGGVNLMDSKLEINWPLPLAQLSDRDKNLPTLTEILPL
ncbi:dTDP-4-dehydrorhamnose 3,5-epimerase [Parasedimentitalea huanghaiensis]|uniref:dTDP-4-dehydrorhamnose 3,5-epimerase n=1 Tax=Parasedimentitalea huanghaiensis TaxID=2682100 RepID=A0A6L6WMA3_9RHOB|nr:dTDP-4-dehydrorhamnose 3,5-epimerase [Zongyanglinia huanghaiensis]MVO18621.1 dTDP-4-dehydrorhamnose 3,5-epimerase [Zongyanglinia huanghaiensis]